MAKGKRKDGEGSIYFDEKRGLWIARFTIGYDDLGKQVRKSLSSKSSADLVAKMKKYEREHMSLSIDAERVSFEQWMYKWIYKMKRADLKPKSFQKYDSLYRNYFQVAPFAGDKLKEVSMSDIKLWYNQLQAEDGVSLNTVKFLHMLLRSAMMAAMQDDLISKNPTDKITFKKDVGEKDEAIKAWSKDEQMLVVNHIKEHPDVKSGNIIRFALGTGLRLGECLALRWTDMDMSADVIHVRRSLETIRLEDDKTYAEVESPPKSQSSIRDVRIPSKLKDMLLTMYEQDHDGLVFSDPKRGYIYNKNPNRHVQALAKNLQITKITFHNLRHTYATRLFEKGVPIKTVQALLGHADIKTTQNIYIHVMQAAKDDAVDLINDFL